ncbi:MAG TPA: restriction endonuclease, partial [Trueperaceae bacterium]|nr:restriction endonuclease [Trueperaceae bacterium]
GDPANGDGGVIAYRDPLGLEPPIPKVQRKRTLNTIGGPDVQKLMGTLAPGSTEVGLFITLGTFTSDTISLARSRHDLRSVNGRQLVDMIFDKIVEINRTGVAVLMVEQNAKKSLALANRGYVLATGQNQVDGQGRDLLENPEVARLYLGG